MDEVSRKGKRKLIPVMIFAAFVLMIAAFFVISDDSDAAYPAPSEVIVDGNKAFSDTELYYREGSIISDSTGATACYDPLTGVLTLNGYNAGEVKCTSENKLTIKVISSSFIKKNSISNNSLNYAIYSEGSIEIVSENSSTLGILMISSDDSTLYGVYSLSDINVNSNTKISCELIGNKKVCGFYSNRNISISNDSVVNIIVWGLEQYGLYLNNILTIDNSSFGVEFKEEINSVGYGIYIDKKYNSSGKIESNNSVISFINKSNSSNHTGIFTNGGLESPGSIIFNETKFIMNGNYSYGIRNFSKYESNCNDIQLISSEVSMGSADNHYEIGIQSSSNGIVIKDSKLTIYALKGIYLYAGKSNIGVSISGDSSVSLTGNIPFFIVNNENFIKINLSKDGYVTLSDLTVLHNVIELGSNTVLENPSDNEVNGSNSSIKFVYSSSTSNETQIELSGESIVISYISENEPIFQPVTIASGSTISMPSQIIREGYSFEGWYSDSSYETLWDFSNLANVNTTLYAKWNPIQYKITFNGTSGTGNMESLILTYDFPANLTKNTFSYEGYEFSGWSLESSGAVKYADQAEVLNLTSTKDAEVKLYAVWSVEKYTISFNTDGGSSVDPIVQEYNSVIRNVPSTERAGYTFKGWSPAVPDRMPAENLTVIAQWSVSEYTISFNTDGGSAVSSITGEYGSPISIPSNPTKTGCTFAGWDKTLPTTMPSENMTFTAKWEPKEFTLTFNSDGGTPLPSFTKKYGDPIGAVSKPEKSGYTFAGWDTVIPETMPAENLTITALWTEGEAAAASETGEETTENGITCRETKTEVMNEDGSILREVTAVYEDSKGKIIKTVITKTLISSDGCVEFVTILTSDSSGVKTEKYAVLQSTEGSLPYVLDTTIISFESATVNEKGVTVIINLPGDKFLITQEFSESLKEKECSLLLDSQNYSVKYDLNCISGFSRTGDVEFEFHESSPSFMTDRQIAAVGKNRAIAVTLMADGNYIHDLSGISEISLLFDPGKSLNEKRLKVFHADNEGNISGKSTSYDSKTDTLVFTTDHHSVFFIGESEKDEDGGIGIIPIVIVIAVILVVIAGAGGFIWFRKKNTVPPGPKMPPKAY